MIKKITFTLTLALILTSCATLPNLTEGNVQVFQNEITILNGPLPLKFKS